MSKAPLTCYTKPYETVVMQPKSNSRIIFEIILGLIIGSILGYIIWNLPVDKLTKILIIAS